MEKIAKKCGGSLCILLTKEERVIYGIDEGDILDLEIVKVKKGNKGVRDKLG